MYDGKKVVVAGHICLDITPVYPMESNKDTDIFKPGKLVTMDGVSISTGGAVANTGIALGLLGINVRLIAKVGNDEFGKIVSDCLDQYHISSEKNLIVAQNTSTSYTVVIAPPNCDRMFLHCPGANDTFRTGDIDYAQIRDASLFHFGYPPLMKVMYENDGEELVRLFQDVKSLGVATSLDMAGIDPYSEASKADWKLILKRVIPYADFFMPSADELCFMIDPERHAEWTKRANGDDMMKFINPDEDVAPLAEALVDNYHAKVVVIKCGCKGIYYKTAGYHAMSEIGANIPINLKDWTEKSGWIKAFKPDVIRSSTGAGDVSIAAFLATTLEGLPIRDCARYAAAEGASCLEGYDALSSLRTIPELAQMFLMGF